MKLPDTDGIGHKQGQVIRQPEDGNAGGQHHATTDFQRDATQKTYCHLFAFARIERISIMPR